MLFDYFWGYCGVSLTTKGKFAVTALLDMALFSQNNPLEPVTLSSISLRQGISLSYLEQLFVKLRRTGLVSSQKGPGGGYVLAMDTQQIKLSAIIESVKDDLDVRSCHGTNNCRGNNQKCLTHDLWDDLTKHVYKYLDGVTIHDLVQKSASKNIKIQ